ncbi:hypothetical protein PVK06_049958 [Gossypium arboreum]|uniref:Uncharacterized protein n=1 Tax=Gossypium arboreum TaxID=29729 RepID=A0ABR0M9R6_GOSAR|nr:hypothetical protein PVK06_049958 [Gossypium arboreum]
MPRNFKAKREETRSMVGPVDEAIAILLDSKPNGDQRPISPPYAWEVDENPFPIGYPLPSLKIVRGFGFCQCLSISCCGLGCQEVSPRGASRRGSRHEREPFFPKKECGEEPESLSSFNAHRSAGGRKPGRLSIRLSQYTLSGKCA